MSKDPVTSYLKLQKQVLDAQRASMTALHEQLGVGDSLVAMQEAGHKATEASFAAWTAWVKMWGWK